MCLQLNPLGKIGNLYKTIEKVIHNIIFKRNKIMYKIYSIHFSPKISLIVQQKKNSPEKCHLLLNETIFFCEKTMDIVRSFHFSILPKNSSRISDIMSHEETILVKKIQPKKEKEKKLLLIFHFQKLSFNSEISSMCGRRKKSFQQVQKTNQR